MSTSRVYGLPMAESSAFGKKTYGKLSRPPIHQIFSGVVRGQREGAVLLHGPVRQTRPLNNNSR